VASTEGLKYDWHATLLLKMSLSDDCHDDLRFRQTHYVHAQKHYLQSFAYSKTLHIMISSFRQKHFSESVLPRRRPNILSAYWAVESLLNLSDSAA